MGLSVVYSTERDLTKDDVIRYESQASFLIRQGIEGSWALFRDERGFTRYKDIEQIYLDWKLI